MRGISFTRACILIGILALAACDRDMPAGRSDKGFTREVPNLESLVLPVKEYLEKQSEWSFTSINGRVFCGFHPLGFQRADKADRLYVWVNCQEFTATNDPKKEGSASSGPGVILLNEKKEILGHESPGDGGIYSEDVRRLFPQALAGKVLSPPADILTRVLPATPERQAAAEFGRTDL